MPPSHPLLRTAAGARGGNRRASWPRSLTVGPFGREMPLRQLARVWLALVVIICSCCRDSDSVEVVRASIERELKRSIEATRSKDIDAYMDCIPEDFALKDEQGATITRDELRKNILRDWSVIPRTIAIETKIDSLEVHGDEAIVFTSQRWEREMLERDRKRTDVVLTTQRHRETWRKTRRGWMGYEVKELGGEVFVNGKPYQE